MNLLERLEQSVALSPEERQLVASLRELALGPVAMRAAEFDASGEFPWSNVKDLNALGMNAMFVPEAYGGAGMSYAAYLRCVMELSQACASTGIIWATNFHASRPVIDFGTEEQKRRLLPKIAEGGIAALCITEPTSGSDATGMRTQFVPDGDDIVINGGKLFITNGDVADLYLLFGKWAPLGDGKGAITAVLVEKGTPGLRFGRREDKMGHRASSTTPLIFEDCRVPRANLLGGEGRGLNILLRSLNKSRPSVAAHALGIARAALNDAVAYINERRQSGKRIIEFQGIQFLLADVAGEQALCESWLWHVAHLVDSGVDDVGLEASLLKMRATDLAMRMTTEAVQLHGGYGYCKEYRVERLMRDAKITQIWEGTNQVHRQLLGRSFVRKG
jgi:alkylation response protein AidB-like acyl-CoA dehydrogenase